MLIIIVILILVIIIFINKEDNSDKKIIGKWTSVDGTIIKIVKKYKDGKPVYANDDIEKYQLEIKKNNEFILYANNNIIENGKYNIDSNNEEIIYFNSESNNTFIWQCKIRDNSLYDCNNYVEEFKTNS